MATLVWLRHDLRIHDNPLLTCAEQYQQPIYAYYVIYPDQWKRQHHSKRRDQYVLNRLRELRSELKAYRIPLIIDSAPTYQDTLALMKPRLEQLAINQLILGAEYGLWERERDQDICRQLQSQGVKSQVLTSQVFIAPGELTTSSGQPYRVFTPFAKSWRKQVQAQSMAPLPATKGNPSLPPHSDQGLTDAELEQRAGGESRWPFSETKVLNHLQKFIQEKVNHYQQERDYPAIGATSRLSPALAHGVFSTRQALALLLKTHQEQVFDVKTSSGCWLNELIWREFYIQLLAQFDSISQGLAFKDETRAIHWRDDLQWLNAWQEGQTGIPIVDAGMRQLKAIGWMHNRVRMITASFFCKNLWMDWRLGEHYFMSQLIDGHLAANNGGWQWSASTGTDAAPYFRIFNPVTQSQKFDPQGEYIRRYVSELASLDHRSIHNPSSEQRKAVGYPEPLVDLKESRKIAIEQFKQQTNR